VTDTGALLLETREVTKRFAGVAALRGVSFSLERGEVHALCGENGAGKSTLIKVLSGIHPLGSYEGEVRKRGRPLALSSVRDAEDAGIAVIYQELALVPEMSVAENVFLGNEPRRYGFIDWGRLFDDAKRTLERLELDIDPAARVSSLGVGRQQLVEICKAIAKRSEILILDEPTAALTEQEVAVLLDIVRELRDGGMSLIYISHRLDEVFTIADRITVLRDGQSIATLERSATSKEEVIRHMVGRDLGELFPRHETTPGEALLAVDDLAVSASRDGSLVLDGLSFEVRAGEVLGIGGLMGSGRTELLMHLFGAFGTRRRGTVKFRGKVFEPQSPAEAIGSGLVLVSEDRKRYGLLLEQSIGYNLSLSALPSLQKYGFIDRALEHEKEREFFEALRIKARDLEVSVSALSGGNQQKVVLGKALMTKPEVILLDEPTRGIDVGAKVEVYDLVNQLTAQGKAVVLVSSELPELLGMSDRILMLHEGRVGGCFGRSKATQELLLAAAMGHVSEQATASRA
jgi:D-xylose transport system ATP-binding protein